MSKLTLLVVLLAILACAFVAAQSKDQVEQGIAHAKKELKELGDITGGRPLTASEKKIRKLTAPKVEYYHEIQKTNSLEVDRTARAIIDTPERAAYREQVKNDKIFVKRVNEATTLLNAHNTMKKVKAPPKLSMY